MKKWGSCLTLQPKSRSNAMDKTKSNKTSLQHKAGKYTEEQARLLLCVRDMVKNEVQRQLKDLSTRNNKKKKK